MWLSIIGEFLASFVGVLGALLVFWLGTRYGRRQEDTKIEWEFNSALQLVLEDLLDHEGTLNEYASNPEKLWSYVFPLTASTYEEQRWRLVQWGDVDAWTELSLYYRLVRTLQAYKELPVRADSPQLAHLLKDLQVGNEYMRARIEATLRVGIKARDRRPLWRRLINRPKLDGDHRSRWRRLINRPNIVAPAVPEAANEQGHDAE
jgi:hypothetical protein